MGITVADTITVSTLAPTVTEVVFAPAVVSVTVQDKPITVVSRVEQGPVGATGATTTTVVNISEPSTTWNIAHYLGRYPSVTLIDSGNTICEADLEYVSENIILATFSVPVWGRALLN